MLFLDCRDIRVCCWWLLVCSVSRREKDASGANFRNRKGVSKEANIVTWHPILKTCSSRLLQGKELQAHWFPHSQRFCFLYFNWNLWFYSSMCLFVLRSTWTWIIECTFFCCCTSLTSFFLSPSLEFMDCLIAWHFLFWSKWGCHLLIVVASCCCCYYPCK